MVREMIKRSLEDGSGSRERTSGEGALGPLDCADEVFGDGCL